MTDRAQFRAKPPRVWVLLGHRAGDRAQLLALANALGWPFEAKEMVYTGRHYLPNLMQGSHHAHPGSASAAQLLAPWPDIVLDCGKRSVPMARWIKKAIGRTHAPGAFGPSVGSPSTGSTSSSPRRNTAYRRAPMYRSMPYR